MPHTLRDRDGDHHPEQLREQVRIALYHCHLPKLEEAGRVDYDATSGWFKFDVDEFTQDVLALLRSHASLE